MPTGTMTVTQNETKCSGYEKCGTIQIQYSFPDGIQGPEHPSPGVKYAGTSRTCFLPDNDEGREILALFKIAWDRKLLFRVGTSVTTGTPNCVVWNDIHHKTTTTGGATAFGYPDNGYFLRVKSELAAKGVTIQTLKSNNK